MMHYRPLGRTGLRPSVIGLGTWQFGGEWGIDFTQAQIDAILDTAAECGINLIDTAECYGDHLSEKFIGDYLARRDRSRWIVATKFGHHYNSFLNRDDDFSLAGIQKQLDASLKALRVDVIDLYQFHSGSDAVFQNQELWDFLAAQKRAGKIRHLGVSIMQKGSELQTRDCAQFGVEALQVYYNRLDRRPEEIYFPHAEKNNLGILARVPLASGLLSGKYRPGATFTGNDVRAKFDAEKLKTDLAEVARLQKEEVPPGVPMAQWAMAWCLRNPVVTTLIPGCKNPGQVRTNAQAAGLVAT
ncbi:MAG TPA: aldo/keto reductase [Candidatus Acidoferrales bacterium]|jgi:aryl-alcohol dehydrogenase-like predicted oxidoreductase|nr:aldo/keto reductase [Candidatus Acidoferrales bacterium]